MSATLDLVPQEQSEDLSKLLSRYVARVQQNRSVGQNLAKLRPLNLLPEAVSVTRFLALASVEREEQYKYLRLWCSKGFVNKTDHDSDALLYKLRIKITVGSAGLVRPSNDFTCTLVA